MRGFGPIEYVQNRLEYPVDIFVHLVIPESQHQITHRFQNLRPVRFISRSVLATINLDDDMSIGTEKIDNIAINRYLPPELQPIEPAIAQPQPEDTLGIRLVTAQSSRS